MGEITFGQFLLVNQNLVFHPDSRKISVPGVSGIRHNPDQALNLHDIKSNLLCHPEI